MRTRPWCALWLALLVACGGGDAPPADGDGGRPGDPDGGPDDPDGGAAPDARPACDDDVCFGWLPPPPVAPPRDDGRTEYAHERCNSYGVSPGTCPDGFACGPRETFEYSTLIIHTPVCAASPPRRVVPLDLAAPPPADPVAVTLQLTLGGGAWPDGSAVLTRAGTIQIASETDPARAWSFDVPSRGSSIAVAVPVGRYRASLLIEDSQGLHYPAGQRLGELIVNRAGAATVDVPAARAAFALRFDGAPAGAVPASSGVTVQLTRPGGATSRYLAAGAATTGTLVVAPGTYEIAVQSSSTVPTFPSGHAVVATGRVIADRADVELPLDVPTVTATASITVDGRDLPASTRAGAVRFRQRLAEARVELGDVRPARARVRLFAGTYDVVYDTTGASLGDLPRGVVRARTGWVATSALALALDTVAVSGTVRRNGEPAPAGVIGSVRFSTADGATQLPLETSVGAGYAGRVFAGTYDVAIWGDGVRLPQGDTPVATRWVATAAPQTWPVDVHQLTVGMTHNGAVLPPGSEVGARGALYVRGQRLGREVMVIPPSPPTSGPFQTTMLVADGRWTAVYSHTPNGYDATPLGTYELGVVDVAGRDADRAFDLTSILVTGEVTRAGARLPVAPTAAERGQVYVIGATYGNGVVAWVPLPASGPATYAVRLGPGVFDLSFACAAASCAARELRPWTVVHQALRLR